MIVRFLHCRQAIEDFTFCKLENFQKIIGVIETEAELWSMCLLFSKHVASVC